MRDGCLTVLPLAQRKLLARSRLSGTRAFQEISSTVPVPFRFSLKCSRPGVSASPTLSTRWIAHSCWENLIWDCYSALPCTTRFRRGSFA